MHYVRARYSAWYERYQTQTLKTGRNHSMWIEYGEYSGVYWVEFFDPAEATVFKLKYGEFIKDAEKSIK